MQTYVTNFKVRARFIKVTKNDIFQPPCIDILPFLMAGHSRQHSFQSFAQSCKDDDE